MSRPLLRRAFCFLSFVGLALIAGGCTEPTAAEISKMKREKRVQAELAKDRQLILKRLQAGDPVMPSEKPGVKKKRF